MRCINAIQTSIILFMACWKLLDFVFFVFHAKFPCFFIYYLSFYSLLGLCFASLRFENIYFIFFSLHVAWNAAGDIHFFFIFISFVWNYICLISRPLCFVSHSHFILAFILRRNLFIRRPKKIKGLKSKRVLLIDINIFIVNAGIFVILLRIVCFRFLLARFPL